MKRGNKIKWPDFVRHDGILGASKNYLPIASAFVAKVVYEAGPGRQSPHAYGWLPAAECPKMPGVGGRITVSMVLPLPVSFSTERRKRVSGSAVKTPLCWRPCWQSTSC